MPRVQFNLNGKATEASYEPGMHFLEVLREDCGVVSPKNGCAPEGVCGCCLVLVDGTPALSCDIVTPAEFAPATLHASLTLYPRSVREAMAAGLALSVFGGGLVEDTIAGRPVWINECLAATLPCAGAIAAWSDPYFLVVEFDRPFGGEPPTTSIASARSILEAVLTNRPGRGRP